VSSVTLHADNSSARQGDPNGGGQVGRLVHLS
jgi:hypothetical protein